LLDFSFLDDPDKLLVCRAVFCFAEGWTQLSNAVAEVPRVRLTERRSVLGAAYMSLTT
jgi:hypothetical protein